MSSWALGLRLREAVAQETYNHIIMAGITDNLGLFLLTRSELLEARELTIFRAFGSVLRNRQTVEWTANRKCMQARMSIS